MHKRYVPGEVKAIDTDPTGPGTFEVVLSAPTLDRDGEVIDAKAFEPLPDHITFDIDHGLSTATTVGSGAPRYDGELLKVTGSFSSIPRAQEVRTLIAEGHIRTTSVAFMDSKRTVKDGVPHIVKAELLNGAFVPVPSNREAVILAAKSMRTEGLPSEKAIEGSYEERRNQLAQAVRIANQDAWWTYVVATFDDSIVYEVEGREGIERFRTTYSISDGDVTLGTPEPVEIVEVVQPAKDESADATKTPAPDPEDTPAATAAGTPPVAGARAQAEVAMAEASLLLA